MKRIIAILVLAISTQISAQDSPQFGVNISPSWKINAARQVQTGLRSNQSGYGFRVGVPVKFWLNDYTAFNTGLDYEFTSFDGFQNGQLVSSFRFNSLHLPLVFNMHLSGNLYAMAGTGLVYNLTARDLNNITFGTDVSAVTNSLQPELALGINSFVEKGSGEFEFGVLGRYQILDIWKNDYLPMEPFNSHIISLDLLLRYYF